MSSNKRLRTHYTTDVGSRETTASFVNKERFTRMD